MMLPRIYRSSAESLKEKFSNFEIQDRTDSFFSNISIPSEFKQMLQGIPFTLRGTVNVDDKFTFQTSEIVEIPHIKMQTNFGRFVLETSPFIKTNVPFSKDDTVYVRLKENEEDIGVVKEQEVTTIASTLNSFIYVTCTLKGVHLHLRNTIVPPELGIRKYDLTPPFGNYFFQARDIHPITKFVCVDSSVFRTLKHPVTGLKTNFDELNVLSLLWSVTGFLGAGIKKLGTISSPGSEDRPSYALERRLKKKTKQKNKLTHNRTFFNDFTQIEHVFNDKQMSVEQEPTHNPTMTILKVLEGEEEVLKVHRYVTFEIDRIEIYCVNYNPDADSKILSLATLCLIYNLIKDCLCDEEMFTISKLILTNTEAFEGTVLDEWYRIGLIIGNNFNGNFPSHNEGQKPASYEAIQRSFFKDRKEICRKRLEHLSKMQKACRIGKKAQPVTANEKKFETQRKIKHTQLKHLNELEHFKIKLIRQSYESAKNIDASIKKMAKHEECLFLPLFNCDTILVKMYHVLAAFHTEPQTDMKLIHNQNNRKETCILFNNEEEAVLMRLSHDIDNLDTEYVDYVETNPPIKETSTKKKIEKQNILFAFQEQAQTLQMSSLLGLPYLSEAYYKYMYKYAQKKETPKRLFIIGEDKIDREVFGSYQFVGVDSFRKPFWKHDFSDNYLIRNDATQWCVRNSKGILVNTSEKELNLPTDSLTWQSKGSTSTRICKIKCVNYDEHRHEI